MFAICAEAPPLSEACIHGLSASLNAPVVRTEELPAGPARAAIVTYAEEYGDLGMAIGLRALESGAVVVFRYRESILDANDMKSAMEAALAFAEGLGFLFDEDMIDAESGQGRAAALEHWNRLMGEAEVFTAGGVAEPPLPPSASEITLPGEGLDAPMEDLLAAPGDDGAGASHSELLLDDLMEVVEETPGADLLIESSREAEITVPAESESPTLTAVGVDRALPLSKFRGQEPSAPPAKPKAASRPKPAKKAAARKAAPAPTPAPSALEDDAASSASRALGRIPIVRRRKGGDGSQRPGLLTRLLASF